MVFLTTSKGFFKSTFFNKETGIREFVYTDKLREARNFRNSKKAKYFAEKYSIKEYFIYKPKEEQHFKDLYEVNLKSFTNYDEIECYCYSCDKLFINTYNDVDFLNGEESPENKGLSFEEAKQKVINNNLEIINKIENVNNNFLI